MSVRWLLVSQSLVLLLAFLHLTYAQSNWMDGRATFYGNEYWLWDIHQGSCGYGYLCPEEGTGWDVAALPDIHPRYSGSCGRCYEIKCRPSTFADNYGNWLDRTQQWGTCIDSSASVVVTITDTCPCNYADNFYSNKRWCCGDMDHLDISVWAFEKLADIKWGVIGLSYREVPCDYIPDQPARPVASPYPPAPQPDWVTCPRGNFPLRQQVINRNSIRDSMISAASTSVVAFSSSMDLTYQPDVHKFFSHLTDTYNEIENGIAEMYTQQTSAVDDRATPLSLSILQDEEVEEETVEEDQPIISALTILHVDEEEDKEEDVPYKLQLAKVALASARSVFEADNIVAGNVEESATIVIPSAASPKPPRLSIVDAVTPDMFSEEKEPPKPEFVDVAKSASLQGIVKATEQEKIEETLDSKAQGSIFTPTPSPITTTRTQVLFQDSVADGWEVLSFDADYWQAFGTGVNGGTALCGKLNNGGSLQLYGPSGQFVGKGAVEIWVATNSGVPDLVLNVGYEGSSCKGQPVQQLSQSGQLGAFSRYEVAFERFQTSYSEGSAFTFDKCDINQVRSLFIRNRASYDTWMCVDEIKVID